MEYLVPKRVYQRTDRPQPVYFDAVQVFVKTWAPVFEAQHATGTFTRQRQLLDVRSYEWAPSFAWAETRVETIVKTWSGVFAAQIATGTFTRDRARYEDRKHGLQPDDGWIFKSVPAVADATVAQRWPVLQLAAGQLFVTRARAKLDVRAYDWAPSFAWGFTAVDLRLGQVVPSHSRSLSEFVTRAAPRLDVRKYDWAPSFSWPQPVVDAEVQLWAPLFDGRNNTRTSDHARLDTHYYQWQQPAWLANLFAPLGHRVRLDGLDRYATATTGLDRYASVFTGLDRAATATDGIDQRIVGNTDGLDDVR